MVREEFGRVKSTRPILRRSPVHICFCLPAWESFFRKINLMKPLSHSCLFPVLWAFVFCSCLPHASAQEKTTRALLDFVENECGGDWGRITSSPLTINFSASPLEGYAGTFSANPMVSEVDEAYQKYYGRWFKAERKVGSDRYRVDIFSRIQREDLKLEHQNFLRVFGDLEEISWQQHFYIPGSPWHPFWTGQTYDVPNPNEQTGELHAHWRCQTFYPDDERIRFSAMHELYMVDKDGGAPLRVQVEVRQSTNQGTTSKTSKEIYQCPTYGSSWYVNGFGHPAYKVWTFTLEKDYDPASLYDENVNLSAMVQFLRENPDVWPGATFPVDHVIRRVETGIEAWYGGDGSHFISHSSSFWWK